MTYRILLTLGIGLTTACIAGKDVGDLDTESADDTGDGTNGTGGTEPTTTASPTATDTGEPSVCPGVEVGCDTFEPCQGEDCGAVLSQFDADNCPRAACSAADPTCPEGRVCFLLSDWGYCGSSGWDCFEEEEEGQCVCGQTADCDPSIAYCIPAELAPPAVERCLPPDPGDAFAIEPALSETTGTAACTVAAVAPLQLDCTGDFVGLHTVTVNSNMPAGFTVGETVTLEHYARPQIEWLDEWLRILDDEGRPRVFAVQATDILPPDAPADFWTSPAWEVSLVDMGCIVAACGNAGGNGVTGMAISVTIGDGNHVYAGGEFGGWPGKFGGEMGDVTVHEARQGSCGATLGDQTSWVSFSIVDILG